MAKLVIIEYKPSPLKGLAFLIFGLVIMGLLISKYMSEAPLGAKLIGGFIGLIVIIAGVWTLIYSPRLASTLKRLSDMVSVEEGSLLLPRHLRLKSGYLWVYRERRDNGGSSPQRRVYVSFKELENGGEEELEALKASMFRGEASILAGFSWSIIAGPIQVAATAAREGVKEALLGPPSNVEWVLLPAYTVRDPSYSVPGADIVIALLPKLRHKVEVSKPRLSASRNREGAVAELRVSDGVVEGVISYTKPVEGRSKAAKLELEFSRRGIKYKATIARVERPGTIEFKWTPNIDEEAYILMTPESTISPEGLLKRLGIEKPLIAGTAWENITEAKLRLVLEIPMARDVVDESEIRVKPLSTH